MFDWRRLLRDGVQSDLFLKSERASELYVDEVLDGSGRVQYLDTEVSVSGPLLDPVWDARLIEDQYRRFLNGS